MSQSLIPVINGRIPNFVKEEFPAFQKYVVDYFSWLETDGNFLKIVNDWKQNNEPSLNVEPYIDATLKDMGFDVSQPLTVPKSTMLHFLRDFYLSRGTEQSFRLLFMVLFGKQPRIEYPREKLMIPSYAEYGERHYIYVTTGSADTRPYAAILNTAAQLGGTLKGQQSKLTASVEAVLQVQGKLASLLEVEILLPTGEFLPGETCILTVGDSAIAEIILSIAQPVITDGGQLYSEGDPVDVYYCGKDGGYSVSKTLKGTVDGIQITIPGLGYAVGDRITDKNSNNFSGVVTAVNVSGSITGTKIRNRGYNYASLPLLKVYKNGVAPPSTPGMGDAVLTAQTTTIGRILEIKKTEPYVDATDPSVFATVASTYGVSASIDVSKITRFSKKGWASNRGFLGENTTLIDSDINQQFSYRIISDVDPRRYLDLVDSLLHPVGYVRSAVIEIQNEADINLSTEVFENEAVDVLTSRMIITDLSETIITDGGNTIIFTV